MSNFFLSPQASSNNSLRELIKKIRTTNNLTQAAFGKLFEPSVTQSTIARWEKGVQTPDRIHFPKIASLLDISFEELLKIVEEPLLYTDNFSLDVENKTLTHNKRHLAMLKKGAKAWNKWREKNPHIIPQLSGINIYYNKLDNYNLSDANFAGLTSVLVSFKRANLCRANLEKANIKECSLLEADLTEANLRKINIIDSELNQAIFIKSNLSEASIIYSKLVQVNFEEAEISKVEFNHLDLSKAILKKAEIIDSKLTEVDLTEANLNEAFLNKTTLRNCYVYGATFLQTSFDDIDNQGIYISPEKNKGLSIENLLLSQCTYLQRYNRSEIKKFIKKFALEEEIIKLGSILVDKYGEYDNINNYYIYNNFNCANSHLPYINILRHNNYFKIDFSPNYSNRNYSSVEKVGNRTILQIIDGIIESNFKLEDVEYLRQIVGLNQEIQKN